MHFQNKNQAFRKKLHKIIQFNEPWHQALKTLIKLEHANQKLNIYLKELENKGNDYATSRACILNVIKHKYLLEYFLKQHLQKTTKPLLKTFLYLVIGNLWQKHLENHLESIIPIINGWIERSKTIFSDQETKFINAILRKIPLFFDQVPTLPLNIRYSTPSWFIERYQKFYGKIDTEHYLQWNQSPSRIYIRTLKPFPGLIPSQWPQFYCAENHEVWPKVFEEIRKGNAYIQDPMTRIPIKQLQLKKGLQVLDLCAAPGGKTIQIAQILKQTGCVVAVDLPEHMKRFLVNIRPYPHIQWIAKDVLQLTQNDFKEKNLPTLFDRVLIDVPCSNSGVIQRKPDIIYRLSSQDFTILSKLQLKLLTQASFFVKPNGLLVYSTCSIDPDENEHLIETFLKANPSFSLQYSQISLPWEVQHDGGASFCLKRM